MSESQVKSMVGRMVRVTDCTDHEGMIGKVTTVGNSAVRVLLENGAVCWPGHFELVEDNAEV